MDRLEQLLADVIRYGLTGNYYDKEGSPIKADEWLRRIQEPDYTLVAVFADSSACVSTVWLGLDHQFFDDQPPLIFESMIITRDQKHPLNKQFRRYSTLDVALEGHQQMVEQVRAAFGERSKRRKVAFPSSL